MVVKPLSEMEPGTAGNIIKVGTRGRIRQRLIDMGVVAGTRVEMQRSAPLGDPLEIRVKGYNLTLRKDEATGIMIELGIMPLSMVSPGETVTVNSIKAGWGLQRRLTDMGLTPGEPVKVMHSQGRGHLIIEVRGSRLALGQGVSHKIMVSNTAGE